MFGIRSSNVSYIRKPDLIKKNNLTENLVNIDAEEEKEDIYKSSKFIFYDDKKKFTNQMEIYLSISNFNNKKLLIIISSDSSIEELNNQIVESLESFPEFKNISGIKAEDIYKISNDNKIPIPEEGKISDFINSGDILYCNLTTDEYWIKTYYNIKAFNFKKIIKLEYKLKKKMRYKRFKLMLMKGGIQLFIENIKNSQMYNTYNYFIKLFEFKIKKHKKIITHNIHNKQKDKMTIDKIINYSSEIIVILKFEFFEKLIHKNIKLSNSDIRNRLRVNEYNDLSFEDLSNDIKFIPEFNAIKELSEEFLKNQYNENNPNFLFFTNKKTKTKKKKTSFDDYFFLKKNKQNFSNGNGPYGELIEEVDEKEDKLGDANSNLNIDEINTNRNNTFNSIKASDTDSIDSNRLNSNALSIENENDNRKSNFNRKKTKSLFSIKDKKDTENENEIPKKKKVKKEKIKNMIIIANFLIKEEKMPLLMSKKSLKNFQINYEMRNIISNIKAKRNFVSNKNVQIYDNKNNINYLMGEVDEKSPKYNNLKIEEAKEDDNEIETEIEFETKPRTFSNKNVFQNDLLFRTFNDNQNEKENDLFLDIKDIKDDENDNESEKNILNYNILNNNNKLNKYENNNKLKNIPDLYEENASSSNLDDEIMDDFNMQNEKNFFRQSGRTSTYVSNQKKSLLSKLRNKSSPANFYKIIKSKFNNEEFLNVLKKYFHNTCNKKLIDKIKMPQSKDMEYLEKEHKFLIETKPSKQIDELKIGSAEYHIYIFMILLFLFSAMILICLNLDLMSIFY